MSHGARHGALRVLLLCDDGPGHAQTVLDHIGSFERYSRHEVERLNVRGIRDVWLLDLRAYDVVVIHYSLVIIHDSYLAPALRRRIAEFPGLKVQFIQDEYRWVDKITQMMGELGIDLVFSAVPEGQVSRLYGPRVPGVAIFTTLTGYVPEGHLGWPRPPLRARPIDVGYRGRDVPFWLGDLGQEKVRIAQGFLEMIAGSGLVCDIAWREQDRIYGDAWIRFLTRSRATLGTESGASITDWDGSIERAVEAYLASRPQATYEEVHREVLAPHEGNVDLRTISPRIFEAIAAGTALVLFPGEYAGIVKPWRHYIPLEKDFSNITEVVERLSDLGFLGDLTERAYEEIVVPGMYSYRRFVADFDRVLDERARGRVITVRRRRRVAMPHMEVQARRSANRAEIRVSRRVRRPIARLADPAFARPAFLLAVVRSFLATPVVARLATRWAADPALRAAIPWKELLRELLRLSVLVRAADGQLEFDVRSTLDPSGRVLRVESEPRATTTQAAPRRQSVPQLPEQPPLVVWSHRACGNTFRLGFKGSESFEIRVDREASCEHTFALLEKIARRQSTEVAAALAPLFAASER